MLDMSYLSAPELAQAKTRLAAMARPVRLVFFAQSIDCDTCDDVPAAARRPRDLAPALTVEEHNLVLDTGAAAAHGVDRAPAISVTGRLPPPPAVRAPGTGTPASASSARRSVTSSPRSSTPSSPCRGATPGLSAASRARLAELAVARGHHASSRRRPASTVRRRSALAHRLAVESPHVTATAVSVIEYPDSSAATA